MRKNLFNLSSTSWQSLKSICREKVSVLSFKDYEIIQSKQLAVCFSGLVDSWPAISSSTDKWENMKGLSERVGLGHIVPIEFGGTYMEKAMEVRYLEFYDYLLYLNELQNFGDQSMQTNMYLAQQSISDICPLLEKDISPPLISTTGKNNLYKVNLWLGSKTSSPCHHDPFQNILCQVFGSKNIILFPPDQSKYLYPAYGSVQKNTSLVNILQPNMNMHPLFSQAIGYQCTIKAGDALFIPKGWWHYCWTERLSCSVNYWWL